MAGSVLNFEIEGEYGAPDRYQITLAGSSGPIGRVLDACGIPRTEAYREGGSVWRRVVEDLESVDRVEVQAVASLLSRIEQYDGPIDGVRRPALYEALSHFYAIYWSGCLQGTALSGACRRWLDRRRYDETADYTLEPIALLVELMSEPPPAEAAPATPRPSVVTNPQWATPPEPEFPERATERGVTEAHVVLSCSASANGRVTDCSIIAEEPPGLGFGREAIAAARRATLSPRQVDGMAASARVTFPVTFTAPTTS